MLRYASFDFRNLCKNNSTKENISPKFLSAGEEDSQSGDKVQYADSQTCGHQQASFLHDEHNSDGGSAVRAAGQRDIDLQRESEEKTLISFNVPNSN